MASEYAQLVAIARRQGRPLEDIGAAWRAANTAVHGNPIAPEALERLTRETKTGSLLSAGVPFAEALRRAGARGRNPRSVMAGNCPGSGGPAEARYRTFGQPTACPACGKRLRTAIAGPGDEGNTHGVSIPHHKPAASNPSPTGGRFRVANVSPHDPRWQVWDDELRRYVGQRRFERKDAAQYARMLNKREAAFPVGRNPRETDARAPISRARAVYTRSNPAGQGSTDWGLVGLAAAGLGYLWWRQRAAPSSSISAHSSAPAAIAPMQLPQTPPLIPYQTWWVKYVNNGQAAPFSSQFPDTFVYDTPTGGMIGLPIPPPLVPSA